MLRRKRVRQSQPSEEEQPHHATSNDGQTVESDRLFLEIPTHSTSRALRQNAVLQMQRSRGNAAVQRMLVQRDIWETMEEMVGGAVDTVGSWFGGGETATKTTETPGGGWNGKTGETAGGSKTQETAGGSWWDDVWSGGGSKATETPDGEQSNIWDQPGSEFPEGEWGELWDWWTWIYGNIPGNLPAVASGGRRYSEVSDERRRVVDTAMGEVGKVIAKQKGDKDPDNGKYTRFGWQDLDKYFESSYGGRDGAYDANLQYAVKYYSEQKVKKKVKVGNEEKEVEVIEPTIPQHWCGHFSMWALKTAGVQGIGNWQIGTGVSAVSGIISVNKSDVKTGDIGYVDQPFQHHFIVRDISEDGKTIYAVEGNSGGDSRTRSEGTYPMDKVTGFYRPASML